MLFNEPKLLKFNQIGVSRKRPKVSVLFNEPKLLKCMTYATASCTSASFSALQRAEIAEIVVDPLRFAQNPHVSVLFNEPKLLK